MFPLVLFHFPEALNEHFVLSFFLYLRITRYYFVKEWGFFLVLFFLRIRVNVCFLGTRIIWGLKSGCYRDPLSPELSEDSVQNCIPVLGKNILYGPLWSCVENKTSRVRVRSLKWCGCWAFCSRNCLRREGMGSFASVAAGVAGALGAPCVC